MISLEELRGLVRAKAQVCAAIGDAGPMQDTAVVATSRGMRGKPAAAPGDCWIYQAPCASVRGTRASCRDTSEPGRCLRAAAQGAA